VNGPARGEIWRYEPVLNRPGQSLRLVVSAAAVNSNDALPVVLALRVLEVDPGGLLAVRVDPHGWASALTIEPVSRSRLVECLSATDTDVMEHVSTALRAAQGL